MTRERYDVRKYYVKGPGNPESAKAGVSDMS